MQTRLVGAIIHGHFAAAYLYPAYMVGGSNVTIEVIHRSLTAFMNGDRAANRLPKKLPRTMFLQLDNTQK
jgi:hypothetical protein